MLCVLAGIASLGISAVVAAPATAGDATSAHATVAMPSRRVRAARIPIFFSLIVQLPLSLCSRDTRHRLALVAGIIPGQPPASVDMFIHELFCGGTF